MSARRPGPTLLEVWLRNLGALALAVLLAAVSIAAMWWTAVTLGGDW